MHGATLALFKHGDPPSRHMRTVCERDIEIARERPTGNPSHDLYLVAVYGDRPLACGTADEADALRVVVSCLLTQASTLDAPSGHEHAAALLTPLDLLRAFACPLNKLADRCLRLHELASPTIASTLGAALAGASAGASRNEALGHWMSDRIAEQRCLGEQGERVAAVVESMLEGNTATVDALACRCGVSRRQLERDFRHWIGMSPGAYARLLRFQRAATAVASGMPLAHVAADCGYADQAHMTRSFRKMAGTTPSVMREGAGAGNGDTALRSLDGHVFTRSVQSTQRVTAAQGTELPLRLAA
jgi:AraC-like DNA-binding protein